MDYESFKKEILLLTGIDLNFYKERQMKRRIDSLIKKHAHDSYSSYLKALVQDGKLYNEFVNYLTINVSEFYRNPEQWLVLENEFLPGFLKSGGDLRIWSSACSTGEEPYTLVMILSKYMPLEKIHILASDIDKRAIENAKVGRYHVKSLEKLPEVFKKRFFVRESEYFYNISREIKDCVTFRQLNLLSDDYPSGCDIILCRNVLIYLTEEAKVLIYTKLNSSLKTGGVLFVGNTEQIIAPKRFGFTPLRTFFYVKE